MFCVSARDRLALAGAVNDFAASLGRGHVDPAGIYLANDVRRQVLVLVKHCLDVARQLQVACILRQ
jgi:hypothetical protein